MGYVPGLMVEHVFVKFSGPYWIGFWDIVRKIRQQTVKTASPATTVGVGIYS